MFPRVSKETLEIVEEVFFRPDAFPGVQTTVLKCYCFFFTFLDDNNNYVLALK